MSDGEEWVCHLSDSRLATQEPQHATLVQGNVIGFVAFDFVLGFVLAGVVDVSFVIHVLCVRLDDFPADPSGLRIPAHTVTHLESSRHPSISGTCGRGALNHLVLLLLSRHPARSFHLRRRNYESNRL